MFLKKVLLFIIFPKKAIEEIQKNPEFDKATLFVWLSAISIAFMLSYASIGRLNMTTLVYTPMGFFFVWVFGSIYFYIFARLFGGKCSISNFFEITSLFFTQITIGALLLLPVIQLYGYDSVYSYKWKYSALIGIVILLWIVYLGFTVLKEAFSLSLVKTLFVVFVAFGVAVVIAILSYGSVAKVMAIS